MSLEMPERRWGVLASGFITQLQITKVGYDAITTWIDRLTRGDPSLDSKRIYTVVYVEETFIANFSKFQGLPGNILSDREPKFTSDL